MKPVGAPLPHVAGDRVQPVAVGRESIDRAAPAIAVFAGVVTGKLALPDVAQMLSAGSEFVSPGVELLFEAAAGGVLPLRLRRKRLRCPCRVSGGIVPRNMHHRMIQRGTRHQSQGPAGCFQVAPGTLHHQGVGAAVSSTNWSKRSGGMCDQKTKDHPNTSASVRKPVALHKGSEVSIGYRVSINLERRQ